MAGWYGALPCTPPWANPVGWPSSMRSLLGEASPTELQQLLDMPSNLLAHHVRVLERVGVLTRHRSEADRRRTYLTLAPGAFDTLRPIKVHDAVRVVFVCTHNSARSQLAAALWNDTSPVPATSAGTHPAPAVHPGAVAAARRHHVPLAPVPPRHVDDVLRPDDADLVITVCDAAHEELAAWRPPTRARAGCTGPSPTPPAPARTPRSTASSPTSPTASPGSLPPCAPPTVDPTPEDLMQVDYRRPDLSIDQQLALRTAATNLAREFDGTFGDRDHRPVPAQLLRRVRRSRRRAQLSAAAGRAVRPPTPARTGQGRGQAHQRRAGGAVPVHPQRRPLPDGPRVLPAPRR